MKIILLIQIWRRPYNRWDFWLFWWVPGCHSGCRPSCPGAACGAIRQNPSGMNKKRPAYNGAFLVPGVGIEPTRYCYHWCLRPTRLPIPPPGHGLGIRRRQIYAICWIWQKIPKLPAGGDALCVYYSYFCQLKAYFSPKISAHGFCGQNILRLKISFTGGKNCRELW